MRDISVEVIYFCSNIWVFQISVGTLIDQRSELKLRKGLEVAKADEIADRHNGKMRL